MNFVLPVNNYFLCQNVPCKINRYLLPFQDMKKSITFTQLSKKLEIPRRSLYRMIEDGRFSVKPIKGTKPRRWSVSAVNKWEKKFK